jgi:DNA replication and repair protein RecF
MLKKISLQNFRNYTKRDFQFSDKTLILGENGVGKTNILEAVYLLATGKSFRADRDTEMISYDQPFSTIKTDELQITITDRKKFEVNGIPRRQMDFVGKLTAVLFAPQDLELITGSPSHRRKYLDFVICQVDREYRRCLISYEKGLRQRNKLLSLIRDGLATRNQLYFWDKLLIKNGDYITLKRREYLQNLEGEYQAIYDPSVISQLRLQQYEVEEVAAATTLVGPHRDDFIINYNDKNISKYGSRGEQRMAILWLKQGEINYLGGDPVLLLDDIFSELDSKHRKLVSDLVKNYSGQVIATTADDHLLLELSEYQIIKL